MAHNCFGSHSCGRELGWQRHKFNAISGKFEVESTVDHAGISGDDCEGVRADA